MTDINLLNLVTHLISVTSRILYVCAILFFININQ